LSEGCADAPAGCADAPAGRADAPAGGVDPPAPSAHTPGRADAPDWALAMLRDGRVGRLATASRAAEPLVVPVCYAFDGERLYFAVDPKPKTTRRLRRVRNIEENPRVSLVVDRWDENWTALRWVIVEGRAEIVSDTVEIARAVALLEAKYEQYRAMALASDTGPVVRIAPDRILSWRFA
jgi:PPOX class probable F420-dependent enzyme